jgi:hypothetical protein
VEQVARQHFAFEQETIVEQVARQYFATEQKTIVEQVARQYFANEQGTIVEQVARQYFATEQRTIVEQEARQYCTHTALSPRSRQHAKPPPWELQILREGCTLNRNEVLGIHSSTAEYGTRLRYTVALVRTRPDRWGRMWLVPVLY